MSKKIKIYLWSNFRKEVSIHIFDKIRFSFIVTG